MPLGFSRNKCMSICLYLDLIVRGKGTCCTLNFHPTLSFIAHFTFFTFAVQTNHMPAFVAADLLSADLLTTNPTMEVVFDLFTQKISQFLQGQFVILSTSWTFHITALFLNFFIDIRCIFDCPKWTFQIFVFVCVQLVHSCRLDVLFADWSISLSIAIFAQKLIPVGYLGEVVILLKLLNLLDIFFQFSLL